MIDEIITTISRVKGTQPDDHWIVLNLGSSTQQGATEGDLSIECDCDETSNSNNLWELHSGCPEWNRLQRMSEG